MKDDYIKSPNTGNTGNKNLAEEILDTLWEPLLVLEEDLRVQSANDAFYHHFKVEPAETVGRQVYDLGNGQWDIPLLRELLEEMLPKETSLRNFEIQHTFEQIGQRTLLLNARRIDHLQLILLAMEDITDLKKNEALRAAKKVADEANRAKSEFMANMSHEIRTPMTVFLSALELLLQLDRDPKRRKILEMADHSAQRLRALLDDLLDFSRIEARKVEIEEEPFDPRQCVREAVEMFTHLAQKKGLELETEVTADTPETAIGDSNRVSQVLINLISNAFKFTHEGKIRVCVRARGDLLEFSVADTGIGIPEDKLDLLFQSFSQVDASFTRQYGGTGLGLAISKGLVELMGGEISVQSHEKEGSIFTFSLPLKTVEQSRPAPAEASSPEEPEEPQPAARILLAEDDSMTREMISIMLSQKGLQIDIAETGRETLDKWASINFDLILMDLQMPQMNGLEVTRSIREKEAGGEKRTCIIGLTAHARREITDECLQAGMDRVLTKPAQIKDLYSAIVDCLPG